LAWSGKAVEVMRKRHPDVPERDWWHDPQTSSQAAEITEPISAMWAHVEKMPGDTIILTGRVIAPVLLWLSRNATHPAVTAGIQRISDVVSTSGDSNWPVKGTAARKAMHVMEQCEKYDEVHIYDDHPDNLAAIGSLCPTARLHQIVGGHLVNTRSAWTWDRRKHHRYPPT
jgi:hypothetical protein